MKPIVLIHGYSAESKESTKPAITAIYGELPARLRKLYGEDNVFTINLSRYVTLDDGLSVDDISGALDQVLRQRFPDLLKSGFHVIAHSTGALVIRNWVRRFGDRKQMPLDRIVYLAGAHFGSGWGHIGRGQFAKWARHVFQGGLERGVKVLSALELGSSWSVDMHTEFVRRKLNALVREAVIIGTEADVAWYPIPIRYAKEDGSDGVIRACAGNLNFNYARFEVKTEVLHSWEWKAVEKEVTKNFNRRGERQEFYKLGEATRPGLTGRPVVPFAIPLGCAHSGAKMGIVSGEQPADQVLRLIRTALETPDKQWESVAAAFEKETQATYAGVLTRTKPAAWKRWLDKALDQDKYDPASQYDAHAQVIVRIRDQDGRPVHHYDVFFDSLSNGGDKSKAIRDLIEDKHVNSDDPNVIIFYLRTNKYERDKKTWEPQVPQLNGLFLEVTAIEPDTEEIAYIPMRFEFSSATLQQWIRDHTTTILDIVLHRVSSPMIYQMVR